MAFLRYLKLDTKALAPARPRYEESLPEVNSEEELKAFFASLAWDPELSLICEPLLKTGRQEQEAAYLEWTSIAFERGVLRVRSNEVRLQGKNKDVPVASDLLTMLRKCKQGRPGTLGTGTAGDKPNTKLLLALKRASKRAGLNCGDCEACIARQECERWFLHKFRATFITSLLRSGMDIRTVMKLSSHADLDSLMRYFSPAQPCLRRCHSVTYC